MLIAPAPLDHTYPHCWRARTRSSSAPTEQWFIELDKKGFRAKALEAIKRDVEWIPSWGEDASTTWSPTARSGSLASAGLGRADRRVLLHRVQRALLEERIVEHVLRDLPERPRWPTMVRSARPATCCPGRAARSAAARVFARDRHPRRVCSTPAGSHAPCSRRGRAPMAGRDVHRRSDQHAAGSSPRCWNRSDPRSAALQVRHHPWVLHGRRGAEDSKSLGNVISLEELCRSTAPRSFACG